MYCLLGGDAVGPGSSLLLQMHVLIPLEGCRVSQASSMLARLTLGPEDGGRTFIKNVCALLLGYTCHQTPRNSISRHHSENVEANRYNEVYSILFCCGSSSARVQRVFKQVHALVL